MCYITDRQNETHHCRPYVGHKTKTPAGWDLLGVSSLWLDKEKTVCYIEQRTKALYTICKAQSEAPSSCSCWGFLIYLRLSFAAAPHGAVFFCYPQACKKLT